METSKLIQVANRPGEYIDPETNRLMTDVGGGRLVAMDLGPSDVHVAQALTNFAVGYTQADMLADQVSGIVPVEKQSDKYYIFDPKNELQAVDGTATAGGASVPEVSFLLSSTPYATTGYALAGFLPMETLGNQDSIVNAQMRLVRTIMKKLALNRELRVKTAAFTSGNYVSAGSLKALGATEKWNGGSAADPVRNIRSIVEAALAPVTNLVMSRATWHAFTECPAVQKYTAFKSNAAPLPASTSAAADQWAALLDIPKPLISDAKYLSAASTYSYVWGGSVALIHSEPGGQTDGMSTASMKSFRFTGADSDTAKYETATGVPGVTAPSGFSVRVIFNPLRGPRGGMYIVVAHNDADVFLSDLVGGLITGAFV